MHYIGHIISPYTELTNMPIQPRGAADVLGTVVIDKQYAEGLCDLEGFSHIYLLYEFHKATRTELSVVPFMDNETRGVYATRSPLRPNHIGLSIVELIKREGAILTIRGVDILDKTPLLDIKPYISQFDNVPESRSGWLCADREEVKNKRSDNRFV